MYKKAKEALIALNDLVKSEYDSDKKDSFEENSVAALNFIYLIFLLFY